jgi:hypothetical protein
VSVDLTPDFVQRLEHTLPQADDLRRRHVWVRRARRLLPLILLVGPVLAWRLMLASPDGVHVGITALAWVTFLLDVALHADTTLLSYLGLTALPTVVGALLMILLAASLLWRPDPPS